jgi:hypothetical protein
LSWLQSVKNNLHRRTDSPSFGTRLPGFDKGYGGETRAHRADNGRSGHEKPAPSFVHAISWHLFLQLDENPAGLSDYELTEFCGRADVCLLQADHQRADFGTL